MSVVNELDMFNPEYDKRCTFSDLIPGAVLYKVQVGKIEQVVIQSAPYYYSSHYASGWRVVFSVTLPDGDEFHRDVFLGDYGMPGRKGGNALFKNEQDAEAYCDSQKYQHALSEHYMEMHTLEAMLDQCGYYADLIDDY